MPHLSINYSFLDKSLISRFDYTHKIHTGLHTETHTRGASHGIGGVVGCPKVIQYPLEYNPRIVTIQVRIYPPSITPHCHHPTPEYNPRIATIQVRI
jgi:hypothetical protein